MKRSTYWILIITFLVSLFPVPTQAVDADEEQQDSSNAEISSEEDGSPSDDIANTPPAADSSETEKKNEQMTIGIPSDIPGGQSSSLFASAQALSSPQQEGMVISQVQTRGAGGNASDELIELYNNSNQDIDVTDWCLKRASSTGTTYTKLVCLNAEDEGKEWRVLLPARSYVLAVSSASPFTGFDVQFTSGLSDAGGRVGLFNRFDQVEDALGWGSATIESETAPVTTLPLQGSLLQRKSINASVYQDTNNNQADFEVASPRSSYEYGALREDVDMCLNLSGLQATIPPGWSRDSGSGECSDTPVNMCSGLMLSEIGANRSSQFIELYNSGDSPLNITGCRLQTNRNSAQYVFSNQTIAPHSFLVIAIASSGLSLTKTTTGTVYLLSSDGTTEIQSVSYSDLDEETTWAWFGGTDWRQTYGVTPGSSNKYQQYASCDAGYERNQATGRCNQVDAATGLAACKEGQYRSEETNRCRSLALAVASVLKPCGDDQFRNPATNRCKKIASAEDLADCGEGRERNPTTNRCRNVAQSDVPAAAFAVEPIKDSAKAFVGWWALGGVAALALGYAGWEWRKEILGVFQRVTSFIRSKP